MRVPLRTCVACRRSATKRELIRLVLVQGVVQVDPDGLCSGRGAYLCGLAGCFDAALRRDGAMLRRALRLGDRRVTLDVDALRAQHCEVGERIRERSDARRDTSTAARRREGVSA